jgi:hypothetical protein
MIKTLSRSLINLISRRIGRKIVVVESDDWGTIRMPSRAVYECFLKNGFHVDKDPYCKFDALESSSDLSNLFDILQSVRDKNGKHPIITANTILANPDFERIKESNFSEYHYEPFFNTYQRSTYDSKTPKLWKEGMDAGIFRPQFHGREHLYVKKWLKCISQADSPARVSFDHGTFGLTSVVHKGIPDNFMGAFNSGLNEDIVEFKEILTDGLNMFNNLFGYRSRSFIATTYTWHPLIETHLAINGVEYLQGMIHQRIPIDDDSNFAFKKSNFTGWYSKSKLMYLSRNSFFEPTQLPTFDWVSDCLKRIELAFFWGVPVILSTHRLNFIGSIFPNNSSNSLRLFKNLLQRIVTKYPDVEFMSSDELGQLMKEGHEIKD